MNSVNEKRKALRQALENHLTTYMGNKTQRNFKNVQAKIEAFINTYTEPVNGGAKPNNGGAKPNNGGAAAPLALPAPPTLTANQITRLRQIRNNAKTYNNVQFRNANAYVANLSMNHANHPSVVAARNALSARAASKLTQGAIEAINTTPLNVGNISTNTKTASNKYASISARLNTLTNAGNQRTFKVINALEREVMKNEPSNARQAMLNKIENKRVKLQENNRRAKTEAAAKRRNALIEEARKKETQNAAYAKYKNNITAANTVNRLRTLKQSINSANLNANQQTNLRRMISNKQRGFLIQQGEAKRQERQERRSAAVNVSQTFNLNKLRRFREEINSARTLKELQMLLGRVNGKVARQTYSANARNNARARILQRIENLKGPGRP